MATQPNLSVLAEKALDFVSEGMVVGLGSGRASTAFIEALGRRVGAGLSIRGIPTSQASADLARQLRIPLVTIDDVAAIDLTIDGADEVDPRGNCIKGYGGALVREKVVAAASRRLVVVVGAEKLVETLGTRGKLPIEVVPFAAAFCMRQLSVLGMTPQIRGTEGVHYVTDNGNLILDCRLGPIEEPLALERSILAIPGIVGTGLFIGMTDTILIERGGVTEVRQLD